MAQEFIGNAGGNFRSRSHRVQRQSGHPLPHAAFLLPLDPSTLTAQSVISTSVSIITTALQGDVVGSARRVLDDVILSTGLASGQEQILHGPFPFQYYPETVNDSRENAVDTMPIPGSSYPVPTVSTSSPRTIEFTAMFSRERWNPSTSVEYGEDIPRVVHDTDGNAQPIQGTGRVIDGWDKYNVDVATALQALRAFTYPITAGGKDGIEFFDITFFSGGVMYQPLLLCLPGTRIGINKDHITCFMKSYSIEYQAFFPDGAPRLAQASLSFQEVPTIFGGSSGFNPTTASFERMYKRYNTNMQTVISGPGNTEAEASAYAGTKDLDASAPPKSAENGF